MICSYNKITGKICQIYLSWYQGQNTGCSMHIPLPFMAVVIRLRKLWNLQWHQYRLWKHFVPWKTWPEFFMLSRKWKQKRERISQFRHSSFISPWAWVLSDATPWEYTSNRSGSSLFETTDKSCNILAGVNSWHVLLPVQMLNVICLPPG